MHILFIIPLPPWYHGGVERVVGEIAKNLSERHNVEKFSTSDLINEQLTHKHWNNISITVFKSSFGSLRYSKMLVTYLKKKGKEFDRVSIHNYSTILPMLCFPILYKLSLPTMFTPHFHNKGSTFFYQISRIPFDYVFKWKYRKYIKNIHFVSKTEQIIFLKKFPITAQSKVIYNGVDINKYKLAQKMYRDPNKRIILFIGRLEQYKNVQHLIKTLRILPSIYELEIIGTGPYENKLKNLTKNQGLESRVRFLGHITDEEIPNRIASCSIFVQSSFIESFGLTCIEALATGVKCIVKAEAYGLLVLSHIFSNDIVATPMNDKTIQNTANYIQDLSNQKVIDYYLLEEFNWPIIVQKFEKYLLEIQ